MSNKSSRRKAARPPGNRSDRAATAVDSKPVGRKPSLGELSNDENIEPNCVRSAETAGSAAPVLDLSPSKLVARAALLASQLEQTEGELERVKAELASSKTVMATATQVAALEDHAKNVDAKIQALTERNDSLRCQRNSARSEAAQLREMLESLRMEHAARETAVEGERERMREEQLRLEALVAHREKKLALAQVEAQEQVKRAFAAADQAAEAAQSALQQGNGAVKETKEAAGRAAAEADGLRCQLKQSRTAASEAAAEAETLRRQVEHGRAAVKAGDIRAEQLEKKVAALQNQLAAAQKEARHYDSVALDLENQLSTAENKLHSMEAAVARSAALEKRVAELEEATEETKFAVEAKEWRIDDLLVQIADLRDAAQVAEAEAEAAQTAANEWRIEDLLAQISDLKDCVKEAHAEAESARAVADAAKTQLAQLAAQRTTDIEVNFKTLRTLESEVLALRKSASKKDAASKAMAAELAVLRDSLQQDPVTDASRLRAKVSQLESQLQATQAVGDSDRAALDEVERRLVDAEERASVAEAARATATTELSRLRSAVAIKDARIEQLQEGTAQLSARVAELEAAVEEGASELEAKAWRIDDLKEQIEGLKDMVREVESERVAGEESLGQEISALLADAEQRSSEFSLAQTELAKLRKALVETKDAAAATGTEVQRLGEERTALMGAVCELQEAIQGHEGRRSELIGLRKELDEAREDLQQRGVQVEGLMGERDVLASAVDELSSEVKKARRSDEQRAAEVAALHAALAASRREVDVAHGKIEATEALINMMAQNKQLQGNSSVVATAGGKENGQALGGSGKGSNRGAALAQPARGVLRMFNPNTAR